MRNTYKIIILILLIYSTYTDIRKREIMMVPVYLCFLIGIFEFFIPSCEQSCSIVGIIPGSVILLISVLTKGALGEGDAYLYMVIGLLLGLTSVMYIMIISSIVAAVFSIVSVVVRQKGIKETIPYAPFILTGFIGVLTFA